MIYKAKIPLAKCFGKARRALSRVRRETAEGSTLAWGALSFQAWKLTQKGF